MRFRLLQPPGAIAITGGELFSGGRYNVGRTPGLN